MADKTIALGPLVTDDVPWPTDIIDVERENIVVENVAENTNQGPFQDIIFQIPPFSMLVKINIFIVTF